MVVALLSLGSTTVNVGMWSSSPCVVCVVSKLAMKSCILVGMDVISQAKVAVVRAYRLGVFREGSEFVLTLRTGPHRSVPLAVAHSPDDAGTLPQHPGVARSDREVPRVKTRPGAATTICSRNKETKLHRQTRN